MIIDNDISIFFDDDDFAEDFRYACNGVVTEITAIFDSERSIVSGDTVISTGPTLTVKAADVPDISKSDTFGRYPGTAAEKSYKVLEIMPDENGIRDIYLTED